jgi:hypothetical protein
MDLTGQDMMAGVDRRFGQDHRGQKGPLSADACKKNTIAIHQPLFLFFGFFGLMASQNWSQNPQPMQRSSLINMLALL